MALAHLCLNKVLSGRVCALARPLYAAAGSPGGWNPRASLSSAAADDTARASSGKEENRREVTVTERSPTDHRRGRRFWRDFVPLRLVDGLGNALSHVTENLSRPLEKLAPSRLLGRMKEDDKQYRLRFEVPGLGKDDVRITVEDGVLVIHGERKELQVEEDIDDDDWWSASYYGYYHTSLLLPDDAKIDDIKAEVKDGILYVTIPRTREKKRNVTEVKVQ